MKQIYRFISLTAILSVLFCNTAWSQQQPTDTIDVDAMVNALSVGTSRGFGASMQEQKPPSLNLAVNFELGSAKLTPSAESLLVQFAAVLNHRKLTGLRFDVVGHTDGRGSLAANQTLSEQRAQAVVDFLSNEVGIKPWRIVASGRGETDLLFPDDPNNGNNRRVEIAVK